MSAIQAIAESLLDRVATAAEEKPQLIHVARWRLSRGLVLQVEFSRPWWTLTLSRPAGQTGPSVYEIEVCTTAFQIPEKSTLISGKLYQPDGSVINFCRIRWQPVNQPTLFSYSEEKENG